MNHTRKDTKKTRTVTQRQKNKTFNAKWIWNSPQLVTTCNFSSDWYSGFSRNSRRCSCGCEKTDSCREGEIINFEIQRLKESRKTALANLIKQINIILPLLADFEDEKKVRIEGVQLDQLFVKMQGVDDMYLSALHDKSEIELARQLFDTRDKDVLRSKQRINDYLHDAKKLCSGLHDTNSVTSLKGSHSSSSSTKLRVIEAKAKAPALARG